MGVPAVIRGSVSVLLGSTKLEARLLRAFTFGNPAYYRALACGRDLSFSDIEETVCAARQTLIDGVVMPRGAVDRIREAFGKAGEAPDWKDERSQGEPIEIPHGLQDAEGEPIRLRPFQKTALRMIKAKLQGLVIVGCGGGKTTIGIAAIASFARTAIVLVHTEDLLEQWREELEEKIGITPGTIADGKINPGPVTIAMIQTLAARLDDFELLDLLATFGVCILDEAHHAPAETFMRVLEKIPARVRLGLTATPKREDGLGRIVDWCFGERLIEVPTKELLAMGYLMKPRLEIVPTDFTFESEELDKFKRSALIAKALEADEPRLHLIASVMAFHAKQGELCLVIANRKAYCRELGRLLWTHDVRALVVTSDTTKVSRKRIMREFREGKIRMLVATSIANEGLNAPKLSRICFAWPDKAESLTDQRTGRLMRLYSKDPRLIDFVDVKVPELVRRYESRARVYKRIALSPPKPEEIKPINVEEIRSCLQGP